MVSLLVQRDMGLVAQPDYLAQAAVDAQLAIEQMRAHGIHIPGIRENARFNYTTTVSAHLERGHTVNVQANRSETMITITSVPDVLEKMGALMQAVHERYGLVFSDVSIEGGSFRLTGPTCPETVIMTRLLLELVRESEREGGASSHQLQKLDAVIGQFDRFQLDVQRAVADMQDERLLQDNTEIRVSPLQITD